MNQRRVYVFGDTASDEEHRRLLAVQEEFDPDTFRLLDRLGVAPGWSCLEIGCGAGSVLRRLAERVGPGGQVVGLDLETRFVGDLTGQNIEVRQGDVATADLGREQFDLAHARFVLIHVPQREAALARIVQALKPGGWLLLEEPDFIAAGSATDNPAERDPVNRVYEAIRRMYAAAGAEANIGRRLTTWMQAHGLDVRGVQAAVALYRGGSGRARLRGMSVVALRARLLATGVVSEADLDWFLEQAGRPDFWAFDYTTVSAWARKKTDAW
jgi:SAM-dependent methyltransferase